MAVNSNPQVAHMGPCFALSAGWGINNRSDSLEALLITILWHKIADMKEKICTLEQIAACAAVIKNSGVACIPTHGLYGLGADPFSQTAVDKVYDIKGRSETNPLLVLVPNREWVGRIAVVTPLAQKFMDKFWPGPLTIILKAKEDFPATAGSGKIGVRLDGNATVDALLQALDMPVTATSANYSGQPAVNDLADLPADFIERLDYILDAGVLAGGRGSTIIDAGTDDWSVDIVRIGEIPIHKLNFNA